MPFPKLSDYCHYGFQKQKSQESQAGERERLSLMRASGDPASDMPLTAGMGAGSAPGFCLFYKTVDLGTQESL